MPRFPRKFVNPFDLPGRWYKGNFHCHTRTSDGALWPQEATRRYRAHGYDVLALTDHENTNDIRGLSDKKMLVINGAELHPPFPVRRGNYHLVALDLPHGYAISRRSQQDVQACLDQVHSIGGVNILAHPRELSMKRSEILGLKHLDAVEVWTTLSEVDCDAGSSEADWADALANGMFMAAGGCRACPPRRIFVLLARGTEMCDHFAWVRAPYLLGRAAEPFPPALTTSERRREEVGRVSSPTTNRDDMTLSYNKGERQWPRRRTN